MRRFLILLTIAAVVVLAPKSAAGQSKEEREVRAVLDRFFRSANSTDEKVALQMLADLNPGGGPYFHTFADVLRTNADVEAILKARVAQAASRRYEATSPITVRVDKNLAWAFYTWRADLTYKDGTQHNLQGRATVNFTRQGKAWKIAHWHSSLAALAPPTAAARDAEAQKLIEIERNAWEAVRAKTPDALSDYFAEGASTLYEGSAYRMSGKDNLLRGVRQFIESAELRTFQMLEPQVQVLSETALLTYYFTESGVAGGKEFSTAGKISVVFVKQGGTWRALHEHRSVNR